MKLLSVTIAIFIGFGTMGAQAGSMGGPDEQFTNQVIVEESEDRPFRFVGEMKGDTCNSINLNESFTVISDSKRVQEIELSVLPISTAMGCSDNRLVMRYIPTQWLRKTQDKTLIFFIPDNFVIEFKSVEGN